MQINLRVSDCDMSKVCCKKRQGGVRILSFLVYLIQISGGKAVTKIM